MVNKDNTIYDEFEEIDNLDESYYKEMNEVQIMMNQVYNLPVLSDEETRELICRAQHGDKEARESILEHNIKFIIKFIGKNYKANDCKGYSFFDLVNQASLGLYEAIENFDLAKDCKFLTYAAFWLKKSVSEYIGLNNSLINVPVYAKKKMKACDEAASSYRTKYGREASYQDIASLTGESVDSIRNLSCIPCSVVSYDCMAGDDDDTTFLDHIKDDNTKNPEDTIIYNALSDDLQYAMSCLSERESDVISLLYGLEDDNPRKLSEVAKMYHLTCGGINFIQEKALRKMKKVLYDELGYAA